MTNHSPFRYFRTGPEIIQLAVMLYIRFPLSLRNVEDLLQGRDIEARHETVWFWWKRFGGEVPESCVTRRKDKVAALKFLRNLMRRHGRPEEFVTDKLRSYGVALEEIGAEKRQATIRWENNWAENSH